VTTRISDLPRLEIDVREALVLSLRHCINPPASYEFIGSRLGVSPEYARMLDSRICHKIRVFGGKTFPVKWEEIK
jgi:hypothetical protein